MSGEYKQYNDFHRCFIRIVGYAGNDSFLHRLFENVSDEQYLDSIVKQAGEQSRDGPAATSQPRTDILLKAIDLLRQISRLLTEVMTLVEGWRAKGRLALNEDASEDFD